MSLRTAQAAHAPRKKLRVAVLYGGWSAERAVSLESGRSAIAALRSRGHAVSELDPAEIDILTYPWADIDAAFIALHGSFGEDGTVQSMLDQLRVPYTGSGPEASRLAMDKSASKQRFLARDLPTPHYTVLRPSQDPPELWGQIASAVGFPLVVKPNAQGSSLGVGLVQRPEHLAESIRLAFRLDPVLLLERFIPGRELTVAVVERKALPPVEIRPGRDFYDYHAKYHDDRTSYVFETGWSPDVLRHAEGLAVSAVECLGCRGVARVDLRMDPDDRPWLLEVNTIPGMTSHSLVPKAAERAGISFPELCEQMLYDRMELVHTEPGTRAA